MKISRLQVSNVLAERSLKPNLDRKAFSKEIAKYLLNSNRVDELESMMRDALSYRAGKGMVEVTAVSANKLSTEDRTDIGLLTRQLYPKAERVIINERRDSSLIGGVKLAIINSQLDLTVRGRLNLLRQLTDPEGTN